MTAVELSSRTGVSEAAISRYLRSDRNPCTDNIVSIANALFVSADYLLGLSSDMDGRTLMTAYNKAAPEDQRVIRVLLERYGGPKWND